MLLLFKCITFQTSAKHSQVFFQVATITYLLAYKTQKHLNLFPANVPIIEKPGSWFLLAKCHSFLGVLHIFC